MTNDRIFELAKQVYSTDKWTDTQLERLQRFAELVRNDVLEESAALADEHKHSCYEGDIDWHEAGRIAAAIRSLKK